MPGVSTKTIWAAGSVLMPRMRLRVVCGLAETAATFSPRRALSSVDLPTLGRPTRATYPDRCGGGFLGFGIGAEGTRRVRGASIRRGQFGYQRSAIGIARPVTRPGYPDRQRQDQERRRRDIDR